MRFFVGPEWPISAAMRGVAPYFAKNSTPMATELACDLGSVEALLSQ
jgi:hypothetical protein